LIDAEADAHLWAERFDRDTGDLFALQDEITSRIAATLDLELIAAEAARGTDHPDALDYILRGRAVTAKPRTRDNWAEMISLFERALALDPRSIDAQSWLANALTSRALDQMADSAAADRHGRKRWPGKPWRHRLGVSLDITLKPRCCERRADTTRLFPNTRRRSRSIATGWVQ
jgi:hypothetical protein